VGERGERDEYGDGEVQDEGGGGMNAR